MIEGGGMPIRRRPLTDPERLDWLRLIRTENVGPITFFKLLERFDTVSQALQALPDLARRGGRLKPLTVASRAEAEREVAANARFGARLIAACEPDYPPLLVAIDDPPPVISLLGNAHLLQRPTVAIVGARNASLNGRRFTQKLAADLGPAGYLVASGLARGIDTAAHEGALAGGTVAVLAGGIDVVYPPENQPLYRRIAEEGVIVAETAIGSQPQARHFPRRNRLISGMALGTVVVEAALRSGSLITARLALEQGREVMAVPGSPLDPRSAGTNDLLRQGATLVESVTDVVRALAGARGGPAAEERPPAGFGTAPLSADDALVERARGLILEQLSPAPVPVDDLIRAVQQPPAVVLTVLLELELAGRLQRQPGNQVALLA